MKNNNAAIYRADIDGLRAIAVIAVVGYHAFPEWFVGGFAGVDIFFVISGFLITSIICRSSTSGGFRVLDFYSRRIRRILPALIAMFTVCLSLGWMLLFPDELQKLGKHTVGASLFVANFVFWSEAGYFDTESELKPLLHLWSLSIEEQFYALWPLALMFFIRVGQPLLLSFLLLLASFLLCVLGGFDPSANFYMPLTRMWELLCGSCLAFLLPDARANVIKSQFFPNLLSFSGVALLGFSLFVFLDSQSIFPGLVSLLPTVGAMLVIAAGPAAVLNRYLLGNPVAVFVGLVSYPLYLWHWPWLSFMKITDGLILPLNMRLFAVAGALVFAVLTYFGIEKPLRHRGDRVSLMLLLAALVIALFGYLFMEGFVQPRQAGELGRKIADSAADIPLNEKLMTSHKVEIDGYTYWQTGLGTSTTLYMGDSNLDMYWPGVESLVAADDITKKALLASSSGCPPVLNVYSPDKNDPDERPCVEMREHAYALAFKDVDIKAVVIGSNWLSLGSWNFVTGDGAYPIYQSEGMRMAMDQLVWTISLLRQQGKTVYLLLTVPAGEEFDPHNLLSRSLRDFRVMPRLGGGITLEEYRLRTAHISPKIADVAHRSGAILLDPADFFCRDGWCSATTPEGEPIYRDHDHLRGSFTRNYPAFIGQTLQ